MDANTNVGLTTLDWVIIGVYALGTLGLGWFYSLKQKSAKEYFVGQGNMNPALIGVSLFATLLSTISYLSMPGEALGKGPANMVSMIAYPLVFLAVGFVLLPVYMKQRVTSAYELLEDRLGPEIRSLGAVMFVTLRLVWMSLLIFLTAKAMSIMLGVGERNIPLIALFTGLVAVSYSALGGLRAVVVTDFIQTVLLFGGALLVVAIVSYRLGGLQWVPTEWNPNWDTQPLVSFDPSTRLTVLGAILNVFVWQICTAGGDQVSVQRFMATSDAGAARRALATQLVVATVVAITLGFVGFALLAYFESDASLLPDGMSLKNDADKMFPIFIAYHLPPGISGLVVAAMFAAAMSSVDSGVNSISAVVMTDFVDRHAAKPQSERSQMLKARVLAFVIGVLVVLISSQMGAIPGNITAVTQKTTNLLTTPIFALFFFALFVPFANVRGVMFGAAIGTFTAAMIAFSGPLFGVVFAYCAGEPLVRVLSLLNIEASARDPISFQWIGPTALAVNLTVGALASVAFNGGKLATTVDAKGTQ